MRDRLTEEPLNVTSFDLQAIISATEAFRYKYDKKSLCDVNT